MNNQDIYRTPGANLENKQRQQTLENERLNGLGGWLILVGIGVVLSPFNWLFTSITIFLPLVSDGMFLGALNPESSSYNPVLGGLWSFEMVIYCLLLMLTIGLIYLFFAKKTAFPKAYIILAILAPSVIFIDASLASMILQNGPMLDKATIQELLSSLISLCIWAPYMLKSKRVKLTFTQ